jgi:divalent metal cation (Fe/Co/Zn/Cd) transporter
VIMAIIVGEAGFEEADAVIAILEGIEILVECAVMIYKAYSHLMDAAVFGPQVETVRAVLSQNPAVIAVSDVKGKHVGRGVSLDIEVILDGGQTIAECNATVKELEGSLRRKIAHLHSVFIHYHPAVEI